MKLYINIIQFILALDVNFRRCINLSVAFMNQFQCMCSRPTITEINLSGMRAAPLSFDDELKNRLVNQRENVYASGATVLKSNYDQS